MDVPATTISAQARRAANARAGTGLSLIRIALESELLQVYGDADTFEMSWASAKAIGPGATVRANGAHKDEVGARKVTYGIPVEKIRWFSILDPKEVGPQLDEDDD